jgi:hypothetical protein
VNLNPVVAADSVPPAEGTPVDAAPANPANDAEMVPVGMVDPAEVESLGSAKLAKTALAVSVPDEDAKAAEHQPAKVISMDAGVFGTAGPKADSSFSKKLNEVKCEVYETSTCLHECMAAI